MPQFTGEVTAPNETSIFAVSLLQDVLYYIDVEGVTLSDPVVVLAPQGGAVVAEDDDGGVGFNARIVTAPEVGGNYFVGVGGGDASTGTFVLNVWEDDFQNSVEGAGFFGAVGAGRGASRGELTWGGDLDVFAFNLIEGLTYRIDQSGGLTPGDLTDPRFRLLDNGGLELGADDDSGPGSDARLEHVATRTGTHYVEAGAFGLVTGDYRVSVSLGVAGRGDDRIRSQGFNDGIDGAGGDDVIRGGGGRDIVLGGRGDDRLYGQGGRDVIDGGRGVDVLIGGAGDDRYVFKSTRDSQLGSPDTLRAGGGEIAFSDPGGAAGDGDRLDFRRIDANLDEAGDQAFRFGGVGVGRVSVVDAGSDTLVRANTDDDAAFEIAVLIKDRGVDAGDYNAGDFFL